jgi:hypothetical protein
MREIFDKHTNICKHHQKIFSFKYTPYTVYLVLYFRYINMKTELKYHF